MIIAIYFKSYVKYWVSEPNRSQFKEFRIWQCIAYYTVQLFLKKLKNHLFELKMDLVSFSFLKKLTKTTFKVGYFYYFLLAIYFSCQKVHLQPQKYSKLIDIILNFLNVELKTEKIVQVTYFDGADSVENTNEKVRRFRANSIQSQIIKIYFFN
jgi:hypothetical protein